MSKLPKFYISQTLLGFGGAKDLNRVSIRIPGDKEFVLCEMGEDRTDAQIKRWHELAKKLNEIWEAR